MEKQLQVLPDYFMLIGHFYTLPITSESEQVLAF